jgi:signal transduction histidine kinase
MFSTDIRPIWEVDALRRKEIWEIIWKRQFNLLYSYWALIPTCLLVFFMAIRSKISPLFYWLLGIGLLGTTGYILLWFWVFDVHDYYLIEMLYLPLIFFFIAFKHTNMQSTITGKLALYFTYSILLLVFLQALSYTQIAFGKKNTVNMYLRKHCILSTRIVFSLFPTSCFVYYFVFSKKTGLGYELASLFVKLTGEHVFVFECLSFQDHKYGCQCCRLSQKSIFVFKWDCSHVVGLV